MLLYKAIKFRVRSLTQRRHIFRYTVGIYVFQLYIQNLLVTFVELLDFAHQWELVFLFKEVEMGRITRFSPVTGALATAEVCLNCVFSHITWDVMGQLKCIYNTCRSHICFHQYRTTLVPGNIVHSHLGVSCVEIMTFALSDA